VLGFNAIKPRLGCRISTKRLLVMTKNSIDGIIAINAAQY